MDGDNQVAPAITNQFDVPGVTFGDSKAFNSNLHAESGDLVRLQFGDIKKIEVLSVVTVGNRVRVFGAGGVANTISGSTFIGVALQAGGTNDLIDILWIQGVIA